jgi:DNA-binding transcriptional LysR family regulator
MDLRQLRYLTAVVNERSVSRAADRLSMTQPPLSTAIAQFERELGIPLLERHPRGVEPTEAGRYLVERAAEIFDLLEEAEAMVRSVGTGRAGRLAIASSPAPGVTVLPGLLRLFEEFSPGVRIEVLDASEPDALDHVRNSEADVALVHCSRTWELERLCSGELEVAMVHREPLVVVSSAPRWSEEPVSLAGLGATRWLLPSAFDAYPGLADSVRQAWERAGIAPTSTLICASPVTAVCLVAAGEAVTLVPASLAPFAHSIGATTAVVAEHLPPVEVAAVWRRHQRPSPVLARFLRAALRADEPDRLDPAHRPASSRAPLQPGDDVRRDLVAVELVEDLVTRAVVDGDGDVLDARVAVALRQELDELPVARQRIRPAGDEEDR